jgi:hypothetical protein
LARSS